MVSLVSPVLQVTVRLVTARMALPAMDLPAMALPGIAHPVMAMVSLVIHLVPRLMEAMDRLILQPAIRPQLGPTLRPSRTRPIQGLDMRRRAGLTPRLSRLTVQAIQPVPIPKLSQAMVTPIRAPAMVSPGITVLQDMARQPLLRTMDMRHQPVGRSPMRKVQAPMAIAMERSRTVIHPMDRLSMASQVMARAGRMMAALPTDRMKRVSGRNATGRSLVVALVLWPVRVLVRSPAVMTAGTQQSVL